jgi:trimeric autotransporter adhesin
MILLSGVQGSNLRGASGFKVNRFGLSLGSLLSAISLSLALFAIPASAQNDINTIAGGGTVNGNPHLADIPGPTASVTDASGNLYVAAPFAQYIFEKSAGNVVSQFAGIGYIAYHEQPGAADTEPLWNPSGLAIDSQGNIYIADTGNNTIRKVDTSGHLTTVAGTSKPCGGGRCGDGHIATNATLNGPQGVAVDSAGNIYIADTGDNRVRMVQASTGNILAFAGNWNVPSCTNPTQPCGDGGSSKLANLNGPTALAVDKKNNVYIADSGDNRVRIVVPKGKIISAFAGNGTTCAPSNGACGDGGSAVAASMGPPRGVAADHLGNIYIADTRDNRIRVVSSGTISTVAGTGLRGYSGDGGSATTAMLAGPVGVWVDASENIYISDTGNQSIRKVSSGTINTVLGGGSGGDGNAPLAAQFANPYSIALGSGGDYFVADTNNNRIRMVSGNTITTVVGNGEANYTGDNGPANAATLDGPQGVALDSTGDIFIADSLNRVVREVSSGIISTIVGTGHPCTPSTGACGDGGPATSAWLTNPTTVALDSVGNIFIADPPTHRIREVSGGIITTIAGTGTCDYTGDGGLATAATLCSPVGVTIDGSENIYIADSGNNVIRCVLGVAGGCGDSQKKYAVGDIITYAYNGQTHFQGDGGPAIKASRWNPTQVALDSRGNLFVGGGNDELVQRIDAASGIIVTVAGNDTKWYFYGFGGDGHLATRAQIDNAGLVIDGNEDLFIADAGNNRIREVAHLVPVVTLTPKSLDFGSVPVGQTSPPQSVKLQNTGSDDLSISGILASGDFAQTNTCPTGSDTLAPSASCTVTVTFTPTKKGQRTGAVAITDNAPASPQKIKLTGVGQ